MPVQEEDIDKFEQLSKEGKYQELLQLAERNITTDTGKYFQVDALWKLGDLQKALKFGLEYEKRQDLQALWHAKLINRLGGIYWSKGELDNALRYFQQALSQFESINDQEFVAYSLSNIGSIYGNKGDLDNALKYYKRCLKIFEELGNTVNLSYLLTNIGTIHQNRGQLDTALEFYNRSLVLNKENGNSKDIANSLGTIGNIYRDKGEQDIALEYYQESLHIYQEIGNTRDIALVLRNIGSMYNIRAEFDTALEFFMQSLDLAQEVSNPQDMSLLFLDISRIYILKDDLETARTYLERSRIISKQHPDNRLVNLFYKIAEALIYKASPRARDKTRAQELLEDIIETNDFRFDYLLISLKHLVELLLIEYYAYGEDVVLQEIIRHLNRMYEVSQEQRMYSTQIDVLVLKSKLSVIESQFEQADIYLKEAMNLARDKNMPSYIEKIREEKNALENTLVKMKGIISNSEIIERIEETKIMDYMRHAKNFRRS